MDEKNCDNVEIDIEAPGIGKPLVMPNLPKALTIEEKKYLLAVERGDMANVRRMLQKAFRKKNMNMNCVDSLGRGALTLAIDAENLEMVELLIIMGVQTRDALLQSINVEFVEAVELLLEHEELIHKEGEPYSWQKLDVNLGSFSPDITPLTLAAHRNNYEILKILLDRGATLPMPHDIKCGCEECIRESNEDSLKFSMSRVNQYKALASPSLIALSSSDPLLTAFQLSWELRNLAFTEQECKSEYLDLRRQCQQFAVDLLDQSRSSQELAIILNHDPDNPQPEEDEHMKLTRLELAINYKQKKFVAHPNIQQLLAAIWYEGVPGFRRKTALQKLLIILHYAVLFPMYCTLYMIAPNTETGKLMRKPFMKFLIHASSYLFFLFILILVSLRAEVLLIELLGTESMKRALEEQLLKQRGNGPTLLELLVVVFTLGFIWEETHEIYIEGIESYLRNMWNFIDFTRNFLYVAVMVLRGVAYFQQWREISMDPSTAYIPRENWDAFDPQLIAEGLFAAANIFSALKLVHLFSINPHLGPLQISLGRMVIDIVKFFFIYSLVLFAFACGLNQLLWYFADLEKKKCYVLPGGLPDWDNAGDSCMKWRSFGNVFEASQSLFWASFGMVGLENFELAGIKSYTRFWGLLMFGSYSVINVIVLLNLLIAMMSNSYAIIEEHSDTEWKFARTRLWMSYFEESATLPPPFNIFPTPKLFFKFFGLRKKDKMRRMSTKRRKSEEKERDYRYMSVMRALVWRYVSAMHRKAEENPVTEDDINEVKGEISAFRCEMVEIFEKNGMDISSATKREKTVLGKKMKVWERRLMKDFQVAPVAGEDDMDMQFTAPENETSLAKFRRIAKLAAMSTNARKWGQVVKGVCESSQIGHCTHRDSVRNQKYLQKAMEEARKLVLKSPIPGQSRSASPIDLIDPTSTTIIEILKDIKQDVGGEDFNVTNFLSAQGQQSRSTTPQSFLQQLQQLKQAQSRSVSPQQPRTPMVISPIPPRTQQPSPTPKTPENIAEAARKSQTPEIVLQPSSKAGSPTMDALHLHASDEKPFSRPPTPELTSPEPETSTQPSSPVPEATTPSRPSTPVQKSATPDIKSPTPDIKSPTPEIKSPSRASSPIGRSPSPDARGPSKSASPIPSPTVRPPSRPSTPVQQLVDVSIPEDDIKSTMLEAYDLPPRPRTPEPTDIILPPPPPPKPKSQAPTPQPTEVKTPSPVPTVEVTFAPETRPSSTSPTEPPTESENAAVATSSDLVSMPSTENLIPEETEKPTVPTRAAREVKPVRRQPKTGWL